MLLQQTGIGGESRSEKRQLSKALQWVSDDGISRREEDAYTEMDVAFKEEASIDDAKATKEEEEEEEEEEASSQLEGEGASVSSVVMDDAFFPPPPPALIVLVKDDAATTSIPPNDASHSELDATRPVPEVLPPPRAKDRGSVEARLANKLTKENSRLKAQIEPLIALCNDQKQLQMVALKVHPHPTSMIVSFGPIHQRPLCFLTAALTPPPLEGLEEFPRESIPTPS